MVFSSYSGSDIANALKGFMESHQLSRTELSQIMGVPRETLRGQLTGNMSRQAAIDKVVREYPWLFDPTLPNPITHKDLFVSQLEKATPSTIITSIHTNPNAQIMEEFVRMHVVAMTELMRRYIYSTDAQTRDSMRRNLGKKWTDFLQLTRAMNGEQALQIALNERRIPNEWND